MTPEPRHPPTVPSYGVAALADLSSSMLASLDPGAPEAQNVLGLSSTRRACLLIVDGLGLGTRPVPTPPSRPSCPSSPVTHAPSRPGSRLPRSPASARSAPDSRRASTGSSVTRSSSPARTGAVNGLRWDSRIDPRQWQPLPTVYERAADADIAAVHVAQGAFRGTGLTVATMRARTSGPPTAWARWPRRRPPPCGRTTARP